MRRDTRNRMTRKWENIHEGNKIYVQLRLEHWRKVQNDEKGEEKRKDDLQLVIIYK